MEVGEGELHERPYHNGERGKESVFCGVVVYESNVFVKRKVGTREGEVANPCVLGKASNCTSIVVIWHGWDTQRVWHFERRGHASTTTGVRLASRSEARRDDGRGRGVGVKTGSASAIDSCSSIVSGGSGSES